MVEEDATPDAARAFRAELDPLMADLRRLRDTEAAATDRPTTLISGTKRVRFGAANRAALVDTHEQRAAALPNGRHVKAERSGHLVMLSEPDLVAAEILRVVEAVPVG
jgi:pimeloyl-ACP methyl ester carboxylesterase